MGNGINDKHSLMDKSALQMEARTLTDPSMRDALTLVANMRGGTSTSFIGTADRPTVGAYMKAKVKPLD